MRERDANQSCIEYVRSPELQTVNPAFAGNVRVNGTYYNTEEIEPQATREVIRWLFSRNPKRREKRRDSFALPVVNCTPALQRKNDGIIWLGHASFFIRFGGVTMVTDPCFGNVFTTQRKVPLPCTVDSLGSVDYVLLSHNHRDHCDVRSIRQLLKNSPRACVLAPLGFESLLKKSGVTHFQTAGWYQQYATKAEVDICLVPANHWCKRNPLDYNTMLWGAFYVRRGQRSVFFAGDTAAGNHFSEIRKVLGPPDTALMPIGAYEPKYLMQMHHLNPEEAAASALQLGAKHVIPMHYGTYDLSDEPPGEPIRRFRTAAEQPDFTAEAVELKVGDVF